MRFVGRNRRAFSLAIACLAALAIAALAALGPGCSGSLRRPLSGGGAVLWRIGETKNPPITPVKGRDGDFAIMSSSLALIVAGDADDPRLKHRQGSIVGAVTSAALGGELEELRSVVRAKGAEVALEVTRVRAEKRNGAPVVVIRARNEALRIEVTTRISLSPDGPLATLETEVANTGDAPVAALQIGDRVSWPDGFTFAPGRGFASEAGTAEAAWIGRRGRDASYALVFPSEVPVVEFEFEPHGPLGALTFTKPAPLPAGAKRVWRRSLAVVSGGLEGAAREAWTALGVELGEIRGVLSPTPAWGSIEVRRKGGGEPELVADAAPDGSFDVRIPAGSYEVVARTPGGEDRVPLDVAVGKVAVAALTPPTPGVLRFHLTDARGRPIPARLVLRGVSPTADPRLGPRHVARGAENVVYTASGEGAIELPIGKYQVTATHGLEHSIATEAVAVSEGKGAVLRASLKREFESPGWTAADFHLHAEPSFDSSVSLPDRVTSLLAENVEFAAATDHNVVTDYGPAISELGAAEVLGSARGVEVTTDDPQWGHFNVWPFPAGKPIPPFAGQTPRALFAAIRAAAPGAILQVNHPQMMKYNIGYFGLCGLDPKTGVAKDPEYSPDFDALEVWNGIDNNDMAVTRRNVTDWFDLLNRGLRYTATGNTDAHVLVYQWAGYPRSYVRVDDGKGVPTPEAIAAAVRAGRVQVTSGPFISLEVGGGAPGDLVSAADGKIQVDVEVRAASWIDADTVEVWINGELAAEGALSVAGKAGAVRGRLSLRLPVQRDVWVAAIARGDKPMTDVLPYTGLAPFAFTNPVFVDVDGDGRFTALNAPGDEAGQDAGVSPEGAPEDAGAAAAP